MRSAELTLGRRLLVVLDPGDDVLASIALACAEHGIARAVVPVFVGAFTEVELIGTTEPVDDPDAPLPRSVVTRWVEGSGSATVAPGDDGSPVVHLHATVGDKLDGARATAGHVLRATVHYTLEVVVDEVVAPLLHRAPPANGHSIPVLTWP